MFSLSRALCRLGMHRLEETNEHGLHPTYRCIRPSCQYGVLQYWGGQAIPLRQKQQTGRAAARASRDEVQTDFPT